MTEGYVRHQSLAEKALGAREGAVDELVDDDERAGRQMLAQRAQA